jgi:hypothetical protein
MNHENLSIEEIREKTREAFGFGPDDDLSYIDEGYLKEDFVGMQEDAIDIPRVVYGHRVSYGSNSSGPTYLLRSGSGNGNWDTNLSGCGGARKWLSQTLWRHDNTSTYCGGSGQPAYRRVSKFTYVG